MISQVQLTNQEAKEIDPTLDIKTINIKDPQGLKKYLSSQNIPKLKQIQIFNIREQSDLRLLGLNDDIIQQINKYI